MMSSNITPESARAESCSLRWIEGVRPRANVVGRPDAFRHLATLFSAEPDLVVVPLLDGSGTLQRRWIETGRTTWYVDKHNTLTLECPRSAMQGVRKLLNDLADLVNRTKPGSVLLRTEFAAMPPEKKLRMRRVLRASRRVVGVQFSAQWPRS
jgi:hypothetical protein